LQKRSLGFKFHNQNVLLRGFVRFAEERGDRYITSARVLAWAAGAPSPEHRRTRLLTVRRFALALHAENARHQIPQADALGRATSKRRPPSVGARTDDASASVICTATNTGAASSCFQRRRTHWAMPYRRATSKALAPGCAASWRIHCLSPSLNRRRCPSRGRGTIGPANCEEG
jgi:hypothetical protein